MPWRDTPSPYYVLVSELMLQQTQVSRVVPKFLAFIDAFPDEKHLAAAPLAQVLVLWSGLGYNRRAKFLHMAAQKIVERGSFPGTLSELVALPGVGKNTAGAILNYAFEIPTVFIETNIRSVYLHHFFADAGIVDDAQLSELVESTLDKEHPREWFWALMDYGSYLKSQSMGETAQSKYYKKQSKLQGSMRETRGKILKLLAVEPYAVDVLERSVDHADRFASALSALEREGLIEIHDSICRLTGHLQAS